MGPTACGKTRIAVALAERYPVELVSVDSALVYRGLDIGTGKPDAATLARAPHRLVDIRDPATPYSAADFRADALRELRDIVARGRLPLLVGGTMLYFKVLRDGLAALPPAAPEVRARLLAQAEREGWPALHARLAAVDPEAAARIHASDTQRLQRALEVYEISGQTLSMLQRQTKDAHRTGHGDSHAAPDNLPCTLHFIGLLPERAALHVQIEARFQQMLAAGFIDEVAALRQRGDLDPVLPALRSVGYRQAWEYLDGKYGYTEMVDKAVAATRQLAKRQYTWLRAWPDLLALPITLRPDDENIVKKRLKSLPAVATYW